MMRKLVWIKIQLISIKRTRFTDCDDFLISIYRNSFKEIRLNRMVKYR